MPRVDDEIRRLLDSDDPTLDEDLKSLALMTALFILVLILAAVLLRDWLAR